MEIDHGLEKISPDDTVTTITIGGTGGLGLPTGTTAQRPANSAGILRWNTDLTALEINNGSGFNTVGAGGGGTTTNALVLQFNSGATEGTNKYTFDGSAAKTVNFLPGTNVTLDASVAGQLTINAASGSSVAPGTVWQTRTYSGTALHVIYGNGIFFSTAGSVGAVYYSQDGVAWRGVTVSSAYNFQSPVFGDKFVMFNTLVPTVVYVSQDAIHWTSITVPDNAGSRAATYGYGRYVGIGTGGAIVSLDGYTWSLYSIANAYTWSDVCFGAGVFVAVASSGTGNRVMTSANGTTWTAQTTPVDNSWQSVCYGNGTFVAVADAGTAARVMVSVNLGVTWTSVTPPVTANWSSVCYGDGVFVAVAQSGTSTERKMVSTDGTTWTAVSDTTPMYTACYGDGMFVSVGPSSTIQTSGAKKTITAPLFTKTINSTTLLGDGDILLQTPLVSGTDIKTINGTAVLGSGDMTITPSQWSDQTNGIQYSAGNISIGPTAPTVSSNFLLTGNITGSTTAYSTRNESTIVASSGVRSVGNSVALNIASGSTVTTVVAYEAMQGNFNSISPTNNIGFYSAPSGGATNYGLYCAVPATSSNYNVFAATTANNYFNGLVQCTKGVTLTSWAPTVPTTDAVSIFGKTFGGAGGRTMVAAVGPSGMDYTLQPAMWRQNVAMWKPPGGSTTLPGVFGFPAPTALGTATLRSIATTNALTRTRRLAYVTATTAGLVCGHYSTLAQYTLGTGTGLGGFFYSCRFGVSDTALQSAARAFCGMTSSIVSQTNVDPATLVNAIGIGHIAADTNWYVYYGGSTAQTRISLGTDFPINVTDLIELTLWSPPATAGVVFYNVTRISATGVTYETGGQLGPGTAGVTLPASTTLLAHRVWRTNNTAAAVVAVDVNSVYIETDW